MRTTICFLIIILLQASCFRNPGRIILQNGTPSNLVIETNPIIASQGGGWENDVWYFNTDSIIWHHRLGNNIHAKVLQPKYWKTGDSVYGQSPDNGGHGHHFSDYASYRYDSSVTGKYAMYPGSSFTIGYTKTHKKIQAQKNRFEGWFLIDKLVIYLNGDTLTANNGPAMWNLLLEKDTNPKNVSANGERKKSKDVVIIVK